MAAEPAAGSRRTPPQGSRGSSRRRDGGEATGWNWRHAVRSSSRRTRRSSGRSQRWPRILRRRPARGTAEFGSGDLDEVSGADGASSTPARWRDLGAFGGGLRAPLRPFGCGRHQVRRGFRRPRRGRPRWCRRQAWRRAPGPRSCAPIPGVRQECRVGVGGVREGPGPVLVGRGGEPGSSGIR